MSVCVCVCARECVCVCVRVRAGTCVLPSAVSLWSGVCGLNTSQRDNERAGTVAAGSRAATQSDPGTATICVHVFVYVDVCVCVCTSHVCHCLFTESCDSHSFR